MSEVVNELGVTVDEVNQYLSYILSTDKDEPVINQNSKDFAHIIARALKGQECALLMFGASYRIKNKNIKLTLEQKDQQIKKVFEGNSKYIYSVASDIVKNKYKNSWHDFISSMITDMVMIGKNPNSKKMLKDFGEYYLKNKEHLSPKGMENLINGNVTDDDSTLELKAQLLRKCMLVEIPNTKDVLLNDFIHAIS